MIVAAFALGLLVARPKLELSVDSSVAGTSQVFFAAADDVLSEARSTTAGANSGPNSYTFELPLGTRWIRWDPVNGAGTFIVYNVSVRVGLLRVSVERAAITPRHQIESIYGDAEALTIATDADASDPGVRIELPWLKVILVRLAFALSFAALGFGLARLTSPKRLGAAVVLTSRCCRVGAKRFDRVPFYALAGFAFWFSSLASYMVSVDDEGAMFRQDHRDWVGQGRWTTYLLTEFVLPQPVVPYLVHALFCLLAAAAYVLVLRAHNLPENRRTFLLLPLFIAFPIWFFIGEFYGNFFSAAVGLLLTSAAAASFSALISRERLTQSGWKSLVASVALQAILVATAMGAYQSFVFAFLCMSLGVLIFAAAREPHFPIAPLLRRLGALAAITISAGVIYSVVLALLRRGLGVVPIYIEGFIRPQVIARDPVGVVSSVLGEGISLYAGSPTVYGGSLVAVGALIALGVVSLMRAVAGWRRRLLMLNLSVACLLLPFSLSLLAGGASLVPFRALVGVPYVAWLFAALALQERRAVWRGLTICLLIAAAFQLAFLHSAYSAALTLSLEHDKALAAEIHRRVVEKIPDFDRQRAYKVDLFGPKSFSGSALPKVPTTTIGRSFFDWDGGNPDRILTFMRIIGYDGLVPIGKEERRALLPEYARMPLWPAADSVRKVGDVVIIKLGSVPGGVHQFEAPR